MPLCRGVQNPFAGLIAVKRPLSIAVFLGSFPVISETFVLRQITGLIDLGHAVDIYADTRVDGSLPVHAQVGKYRLMARTTFMDMPPETAPWEMPVWPLWERTWPPGSTDPIPNLRRLARAFPKLARCLVQAPMLTHQVLRKSEYGYQSASLSSVYRLSRLLQSRGRYDVLHAHFGPVANSFRFAQQLFGAPMIVSFHGYDFSSWPRQQGPGAYQRLFETAAAFTVNSDYTCKRVEQLGCPSSKIQKLPMGLNPDEYVFRERTLLPGESFGIVTVGRLVEIKGHEHGIRAVAALREKLPDVHYDIVGDGPLRSKLERLVGELGQERHVTLHGALADNQVKALLERAHVFMLASISVDGAAEGQGLALQEAQASGLPVIATDHGAFSEGILPGESGYLVPERNIAALAGRLEHLARHPELWPAMGRAGRKFVERHYDIRELNLRLIDLYNRVTAGFKTGS
jgi:colanic acid/amylovoran biosynthesis glycosyltransferase